MKVHVYEIHAFTEGEKGGNAAGVVIQPGVSSLTEAQMLDISARMGFSETAFVMESELADYKVRFFTPTEEVELCGHATIGAFWLLEHLGYLKGRQTLVQETKAGLLRIKVSPEEILMEQAAPDFGPILEPEEIFWSLGLSEDQQAPGLPVQIVSTGLKDILVPVNSIDALRSIQPDLEEIRKISEVNGVTGYHCFALASGHDLTQETSRPAVTACCRNFAPLFGIAEESATGTSNGALAAYLSAYGAVNGDASASLPASGTDEFDANKEAASPAMGEAMSFVQGMWMDQPSRINARVLWIEKSGETLDMDPIFNEENPQGEIQKQTWIQSVWVGGSAALSGETTLEI
ncbi:PhzF family phenazine biosynthesis protein [Acidaminobacter sp.]|uniref:PhzF family phenazine biosynthesis protein n=1 Tax=Acidaminobacter sp. TaxID=1872102 RepID=UPI00137CB3D9|nr:PhzF family phenazine biosynthesis protein [Acidaminobacter sp.]MDK9712270.1 PhzF family phenazine biosynthesis protein [Acidaminobacter sp.]MZQ96440.1 PhzF family phenazine biosynthesis isomerase [Acidaminobacter sp.]